jgi:hypothetical protein
VRQHREQQKRHDIGDLDHRVHGWTGGVLVGSPTVSPVTAALRLRALAAIVTVLDVFRAVPGATAGRRDGDEKGR